MKILILGGNGMLGHRLFIDLAKKHDIAVTLRKPLDDYGEFSLFNKENSFDNLKAENIEEFEKVVKRFKPEAVINCIGIVKQRESAKNNIKCIEINALFPHRLALVCKDAECRLIHISTDCVFSGKRGNYKEDDFSDAEDLYGRTKYIGELSDYDHCLTIRSSIIGYELLNFSSLLEWFLAQKGTVKGYTHAIYSGFSTIEMGRIIEMILTGHREASGLYNVASDPISKYDLLCMVKEKMEIPVKIEPYDGFLCDRSLDASRFRKEFCYNPPSWKEMVEELASSRREYGK